MLKSLLLGTLLGGLVAFAWSTVSWEVIGWHEKTMEAFDKDEEVSAMILSHTTKSGVYLLPGAPMEGMTAEQKKAAKQALMPKMQRGPVMFAALKREGFGSFGKGLAIQVASLFAAAFLLTWLLLQTSGLSYGRKVLFLGVAGLAASVIVDLPNWNWWGFSGSFTMVNLADTVLTWLIAGFVIAKVAKTKTA